jgi:hypothetical protein
MHAMKVVLACSLLPFVMLAGVAHADNPPFTGRFAGHGRQCEGQLRVTEKTIEWHTPFANCTTRGS